MGTVELSVQVGTPPKTLLEAVESFVIECAARGLSKNTIALNCIILRELTNFLGDKPIEDVTTDELRRFFVEKATSTSVSTAARYHNTIHRLFTFLAEDGFIPTNPMAGVKKPKVPAPVIKPLTPEQIEALIAACDAKSFVGLRDKLILLMLIDCGLRASELANLTLDDVDLENQIFLVRHGKGGKSRRVPFGKAVLAVLRAYLAKRAEVTTPNLIVTVYGDPVDRYRLRAIVTQRGEKAGVKCTTHLLRHTCAVSYLRAGGDAFSLQKLLGHSTLTMTRRYCELADSDIAEKHRLYSPADRIKNAGLEQKRRRLR
mgnify:CR=1 FL=1